MSEHLKALDKAKIELMRKPDSVFFMHLCFSLHHVFDDSIPTACTDGLTIRYNPDFFMGLSRDEQVFLLLHETLHVALQHILRLTNRDPRKWNVAGDYVINHMLVSRGFRMPSGGLYDAKYDEAWTTEEVYDDLDDNHLPNLPMQDLQEPDRGEHRDENGVHDQKAHNGGALKGANAEELKEQIDRLLVQASLQAHMAKDRSAGNIPGMMQFYIDSLRTPKLPWYRILRQFMSKTVKRGYSWRRPNRRFIPKHYLPSRNSQALCDIAVIIDTSCSVTDEEFQQFVSETYLILKQYRPTSLTLVQFDTAIRAVNDIQSPKDLLKVQFTGRGGTRFHEPMDWIRKHRPTVTLVFTDGVFRMPPKAPKTPVIWLINDNPRFQALWGKVIHYEMET